MASTRGPSAKKPGPNGKGSKGRKDGKTDNKSSNLGQRTKQRDSRKPKAPPPVQQKTKSSKGPLKRKRKVYTEKELGLPKLNMVTPVGVEKPKGKKKGKIFVDDAESMMTILAIVNADKEGHIESKMMKSRQMEEIREARRVEADVRQAQRKSKLEETKDSLRRGRKRKSDEAGEKATSNDTGADKKLRAGKKRVAFS